MSDIRSLGDGRFRVARAEADALAYAVAAPSGTWVFLDGRVYVIDQPAAVTRRTRGGDFQSLAAPMPASVVSVDVAPGQQVKAGDTLIVLEAMKMELVIRAPHDARITRIACAVGDLVQPGVPLVELA